MNAKMDGATLARGMKGAFAKLAGAFNREQRFLLLHDFDNDLMAPVLASIGGSLARRLETQNVDTMGPDPQAYAEAVRDAGGSAGRRVIVSALGPWLGGFAAAATPLEFLDSERDRWIGSDEAPLVPHRLLLETLCSSYHFSVVEPLASSKRPIVQLRLIPFADFAQFSAAEARRRSDAKFEKAIGQAVRVVCRDCDIPFVGKNVKAPRSKNVGDRIAFAKEVLKMFEAGLAENGETPNSDGSIGA